PDRGPPGHQGVTADARAVADLDARADDRARSDLDAGAELGAVVDERRRVNGGGHAGLRSTTVASSSASATSWSSTNASPFIFDVDPLSLSSVSLNLSWPPRVTGRRQRAPSLPM